MRHGMGRTRTQQDDFERSGMRADRAHLDGDRLLPTLRTRDPSPPAG